MMFVSALFAVLTKELVQLMRDRLTFGILFGLPIIELLFFGFAINADVKQVPTAVLDFSRSSLSRSFLTNMEVSGYFQLADVAGSLERAESKMMSGDVMIIVVIPSDLSERVHRGEKPALLVEADMTDPVAVNSALSTLEVIGQQTIKAEFSNQSGHAQSSVRQLDIVLHKRFNPEAITRYNFLPGLQGVILEISLLTMVGLSFTREKERGTVEMLLALPINPAALVLGKTLTYVGVGFIQSLSVLLLIRYVFVVPFEGSPVLVAAACMVFVVASVLLGYLFSTFSKTQMQVMNIIVFYFLITVLLSGFIFPFHGMPSWARGIGEALPLTHFMRIVRGVMLKGSDLWHIGHEFGILLSFIAGFYVFAVYRFSRTLD